MSGYIFTILIISQWIQVGSLDPKADSFGIHVTTKEGKLLNSTLQSNAINKIHNSSDSSKLDSTNNTINYTDTTSSTVGNVEDKHLDNQANTTTSSPMSDTNTAKVPSTLKVVSAEVPATSIVTTTTPPVPTSTSIARSTPVPCPLGCRCSGGRRMHSRHHWHRILAAYRTKRLLYGQSRTHFPFKPNKNPNMPEGRQMVCVGLPDMPDYVPGDVQKVVMYGSLSHSWEMQQLDEPDDPEDIFNSDSAIESPSGLRQITNLGKLNFIRSSGMKQLIIEGNKLRVLFPKDFEMLSSIRHLHLRNNQIMIVSIGAFHGLENVQEIDLSQNHISRLPKTTFYMLRKVRKLSLAKNRLVTLHENIFSDLEDLMHLDISFNFFTDLPTSLFSSNKNLKTLNMKSNSFIELHPEWLKDLPNLVKLDFSSNRIINIQNNSFSDLANVTWLNFNSNDIWNLTQDGLQGLENLQILKIQYNNISVIEEGTFTNKTSLRELYLDDNQMTNLTSNILDGLDNLRIFSITNNKLTQLSNSTFSHTRKLRKLMLSHNNLKTVINRNFYDLLDLLELRLDHNQIKSIDDDGFVVSIAHTFSKLTWLHLNHNKLTKITAKMFRGIPFLKYLNLGHNDIQVIDEGGLAGFGRLNTLILNSNGVSDIKAGAFKQLYSIKHINLASNRLDEIGFNTFLGLKTLEDINLGNNQLNEFDYQVFLDTPRLSSLNLKKNKIKYVDFYLLDTLDKLRYLDLSNNKINNITYPIFTLRSLFSLSLADNYFQTLPANITQLVSVRGAIHLYGNPWECDCRMKWLAGVTRSIQGVYIVKGDDILCKSPKTLIGEKIKKLSVDDLCNSPPTNLAIGDQPHHRKFETGCSFTPLAEIYGRQDEIRNSMAEPHEWVTSIFSRKTGKWLCSGIRMARDQILVHTFCVKQPNFETKVKVLFGSTSQNNKLHYTVIEEVDYYNGPLDLAMIKITKVKKAPARVFPCILNSDAVSKAMVKSVNAVIVSMKREQNNKDAFKLYSFLIHSVDDPCIPGKLCFKFNENFLDRFSFQDRHLPIFFKVGKSRWALGAIGDLKSYGNILSNPLPDAINWIHKTI